MRLTTVFLALALTSLTVLAAESPAEVAADKAKVPAAREQRPDCLKETGSRVKPKEGECIEAPGQVLTREDIDRTGSVDTADAIRKLVPSAR